MLIIHNFLAGECCHAMSVFGGTYVGHGSAQHPQWARTSQEAHILWTLLLSLEIYQTVRRIESMQSHIHT